MPLNNFLIIKLPLPFSFSVQLCGTSPPLSRDQCSLTFLHLFWSNNIRILAAICSRYCTQFIDICSVFFGLGFCFSTHWLLHMFSIFQLQNTHQPKQNVYGYQTDFISPSRKSHSGNKTRNIHFQFSFSLFVEIHNVSENEKWRWFLCRANV